MDKQRLKDLLQRFEDNSISTAEFEELDNWFHQQHHDVDFATWLKELGGDKIAIQDMRQDFRHRLAHRSKRKFNKTWLRVAAAILIAATAGTYFVLRPNPTPQMAQTQKQDVLPGSNKAILTLANGQKVNLTNAQAGTLANQQGYHIQKQTQGTINYTGTADANTAVTNTITTPNGGTYSVTLADGTLATLDAGSSLTYPVFFNGKERRVAMTGQVYFSVKHNAKQPFLVTVNGQTIRDIGTEFNVKAYKGTTTTLVSGAVQLEKDNHKLLMTPGQQAVGLTLAKSADAEEATAWKNGYFKFRETVPEIMDKISRWYDIEVSYAGKPNNEQYFGKIDRKRNVSAVLAMMEKSGIHFKIEGRRITVMP